MSKIAEARSQAENAQKNDWDIIAEIRGSKKLSEGKVQLIGKTSLNLNYAAITQNAYSSDTNVREDFRVLGQQGAYSFTEVNLPLYAGMEFNEEGYAETNEETNLLDTMDEELFEAAQGACDRTHNEFLQYAFFFGIPAALVYIVAVFMVYLKGMDEVELPNFGPVKWNSKKWRAWAIVNKDIVLVNRQYPYHNDNIGIAVVDWIKELAQKNLGWSYGETEARLDYSAYGFSFDCGYMYNDICGCHAGCVAPHIQKNTIFHHGNHSVWFSGPAECMWCGREIKWDEGNDSGTLTCPECHGATRCVCCGEVVYGDYAYWGPDDQPYCADCYSDNFTNCDHCDDMVPQEEAISLEFPIVQHVMTKYIHETPVGSSGCPRRRGC